ncbi:MAG TPA: HAD-IA family hydrolase [Candidatus Eisenbacteria bacterium]|nr:HAD-IA family hydrolase [Candidatus Eisenbacteria bacterium]
MEPLVRPALLTFDVFGTLLDWRRGMRQAVERAGGPWNEATFDRVVDAQGRAEGGHGDAFRRYADITAESLVEVVGLSPAAAEAIGATVGTWPPYPDSPEGLRRLMRVAPCAAMTNSDRAHGVQAQESLGVRLTHWICAEESRAYKPSPDVWRYVSRTLGVPFGRSWWHVSAYGDYDLATARSLGLTCVYVERPHARPGPEDVHVGDLIELAAVVESLVR